MTISINNVNTTSAQQKPRFKGKWQKTEQGIPYYKTNSAMKIGGTLAGISAAFTGLALFSMSYIDKTVKSKEMAEMLKKSKASYLIAGLIGVLGHIGSAAYIDSKRNQKSMETANYIKQVGIKNAMSNNEDIALSNRNRPYYESNIGSKYGAGLGAIIGTISGVNGLIESTMGKKGNISKSTLSAFGILRIVASAGFSALGGWLLGKWSDNIANNDARKHV